MALSSNYTEMSKWLDTPLGQVLLKAEKSLLGKLLPRRFGYHLLQLGCADLPLYNDSPIGHKFSLSADISGVGQAVIAQGEALPIATESVDLVLIHHALDISTDKHQLLREVSRVLIEGGHAIIIGFNPYSTWGIRNKLQWTNKAPWHGKLLTPFRLTDWLKLLEFQIKRVDYGLYTMPVNSQRVIKYSSVLDDFASKINWPTGGIYVISAKKEVLPLTPIKGPWRELQRPGVGMPVSENVSSRGYKNDGCVDSKPDKK